CGLTGHQKTLRQAVDGVEATDGPTMLTEAVTVARRLAVETGQAKSQVVIISDGCAEGAPKLAEAENTNLITVGRRTGNVGITRFQVRRSTIDPIGYEILAE